MNKLYHEPSRAWVYVRGPPGFGGIGNARCEKTRFRPVEIPQCIVFVATAIKPSFWFEVFKWGAAAVFWVYVTLPGHTGKFMRARGFPVVGIATVVVNSVEKAASVGVPSGEAV